jgi:hypothetical protein
MKDSLDKVMEYEPSGIVPDMDNHAFDVDEEEEEDGDDDEVIDVSNGGNMKACLLNLWDVGWDELAKVNVKQVRKHTVDCLQRKRDTMKYIMKQVLNMKSSSQLIVLCKENMTAVSLTWSMYLDELRPNTLALRGLEEPKSLSLSD